MKLRPSSSDSGCLITALYWRNLDFPNCCLLGWSIIQTLGNMKLFCINMSFCPLIVSLIFAWLSPSHICFKYYMLFYFWLTFTYSLMSFFILLRDFLFLLKCFCILTTDKYFTIIKQYFADNFLPQGTTEIHMSL